MPVLSARVSKKPMATSSVSVITSSLTSLSFSSQISQNFRLSSLCFSKSLSLPKNSSLVISASAVTAPSPVDIETEDLETLLKFRLPGGFAAQPIFGTGRRKSATARVVLQDGSGRIIINYRDATEYLQGNPLWIQYARAPLAILGYESSFDVFVKVEGGGLSGQAQAISLGIARALLKVSGNHRAALKDEGLLTRDSRIVERKKVGLKKARKRPQFSKR